MLINIIVEDESTDKHSSPVLATAIPLREKRGGEGDGEWREGRENGEGRGKEVAVMQLVREINDSWLSNCCLLNVKKVIGDIHGKS